MPTEFAVIDERSAREALIEAGERMVNRRARRKRARASRGARGSRPRHAPEERFGELMAALAAERGKLRRALPTADMQSCATGSAQPCVCPRRRPRRQSLAAFCAAGAGDEAGLRAAAAALGRRLLVPTGSAALILPPGARRQGSAVRCLPAYLGVFLTDEGGIRKSPDHPRTRLAAPVCDAAAVLGAEAERVKRFRRRTGRGSPRRGELRAGAARRRVDGCLCRAQAGPRACSTTTISSPWRSTCCADPGWRLGCCSSSMAGSTTS